MNRLSDLFMKKIKDTKGESLAETLVSLVIASMGMIILAGAIVAASRVNASVRTDQFEENEFEVSEYEGTITIQNESGAEVLINYPTEDASNYESSTEVMMYEVVDEDNEDEEEKYYYWNIK